MTEPSESPQAESAGSDRSDNRARRFAGSIARNPFRSAQILFFTLVAIIILQNLESTSIDVLFWSVTSLPKLVLIFLSMIVGAAAWELIRRITQ